MHSSSRYRFLVVFRALLVVAAVLHAGGSDAANGDILARTSIGAAPDLPFVAERVVYESDGLRIVGFLAYPKSAPVGEAKLPSIMWNRGGNRAFGEVTDKFFLNLATRVTDWGYVLFASNYRGSTGSEGNDEFGGNDVNDVINAISVVDHLGFTDPQRMGVWGHSRGGLMTYLALTKTTRFKAAVIGAGPTDVRQWIERRPEMETEFAETVPHWGTERAQAIKDRSASQFVERLPMNVPILLIHGTADWRVDPRDSMTMATALIATRRPVRLLMVEGADHVLTEHRDDYIQAARSWFDRFVRNGEAQPNLVPHGS